MNERCIEAFWLLYRAGLSAQQEMPPAQANRFPLLTDEEWKAIAWLGDRHRLDGLLFEGMTRLPARLRPSQQLLQAWLVRVELEHVRHRDCNLVIADLMHRWHETGLHPVLLKGQGYARLFPNPERRKIGDIDVFVPQTEFDRALEVVRSLPLDSEDMPDIGKHIEFFYRREGVELHRRSAQLFHCPQRDAEYQAWSEAVLPASQEGFYITEAGEWADAAGTAGTAGEWVRVAPPDFEACYCFIHLWGHIVIGMPSLRAFADWMQVLRRYHDRIDPAALERRLRRFRLLRAWQVAGCFAVQYLGLEPSAVPCHNPRRMAAARHLHRYLSRECLSNYRAGEIDPRHPLLGRLRAAVRQYRTFADQLAVMPSWRLPLAYLCYSVRAVYRAFARWMGKEDLQFRNVFPES